MVVLGLCASEVAVRATFPHRDLAALTGRRAVPSPMSKWAATDAFAAYRARSESTLAIPGKTVNTHGFQSTPELEVAKPAGSIRIAFFGGSSTAGTGRNLRDEETWPWQVAEQLREAHPANQIELINAALGGYTSFESYGRLWSRIRFFEPDVAVVYHGWNEMYYFTSSKADAIHNWRTHRDGSWSIERPVRVATYEPWKIDSIVAYSQIATRVRLRMARPREGEVAARAERARSALASSFDPRGPEIFRTNLRLFRDTAQTLGIELYVVKQATLIVDDLAESERARCAYRLHGFDHDAHVAAYRAIYDVIDQEIAPERIIDATPLSGRPELFYDHVHPTPEGATAISRLVARALEDRVLNRDRPVE